MRIYRRDRLPSSSLTLNIVYIIVIYIRGYRHVCFADMSLG